MLKLLALVLAAQLQAGVELNETNCDWYVWDRDQLWGWCTIYSNDGKTCRGKFFVIPSPKQYLDALRSGETVSIPSNLHPTDAAEIAKVGGLKPLPPRAQRLTPDEAAEFMSRVEGRESPSRSKSGEAP